MDEANSNESATDTRRYGEPDWEYRPRVAMNLPEFFPTSNDQKSFEEWLVEMRGIKDSNFKRNSFASVRFDNPLAILSGNSEMVDVVVGDDPANKWHLHRPLLCSQSRYFNAIVSSRFKEGIENKVTLDEEDNAVFALFVQWLYSRGFSTSNMDLLLRAYVMGDRLGAPGFANFALDRIFIDARWHPFTPEQVIWVTEHTMPTSALRKLIIDTVAFRTLTSSLTSFSEESLEILAPVHGDILQAITQLTRENFRINNYAAPLQMPPRSAYTDPS